MNKQVAHQQDEQTSIFFENKIVTVTVIQAEELRRLDYQNLLRSPALAVKRQCQQNLHYLITSSPSQLLGL